MPLPMRKLISLSASVSGAFSQLTGKSDPEWFCSHDPEESRLGSGGGTLHLLHESWEATGGSRTFKQYLRQDKGIILHAGGQSRRLPAYAAEGKAMIPVPVFRWSTGQKVTQTLLDLQMPFLERVLRAAGRTSHWLIASGDVLLDARRIPQRLPEADVICLGLWGEPEQAMRHGVFFTPRTRPGELSFMLQKPSHEEIRREAQSRYFLLDVGVWVLSARAMEVLLGKCQDPENPQRFCEYDLYGAFGPSMGTDPILKDAAISALTTAIVPLDGGEFYHFGSGPDLLASTLRLQNRVIDQRRLTSHDVKPHPSLFVQNSEVAPNILHGEQSDIWIENAHIPEGWTLQRRHLLTGIPRNDWRLKLPEGLCLEVLPLRSGKRAVRVYGYSDPFRGALGKASTLYQGEAFGAWLEKRGLTLKALGLSPQTDIQTAALFPVFASDIPEELIQWLVDGSGDQAANYLACPRLSAEELSAQADLLALAQQRRQYLVKSLPVMAANARRSVFYQVDLENLSRIYAKEDLPLPEARPDPESELFRYVRDAMFRATVLERKGMDGAKEAARAFGTLREAMIRTARETPVKPERNILDDQILWARSPVRLDLAGGWTDTPPYCFINGGKVINLAVELNGQPPIQAFIRPRPEGGIKVRSIDLGVSEEIRSFDDLWSCAEVGSGFAIPKAALALCGFVPEFYNGNCPPTLEALLERFGVGIEISLLCAVPKGSGLGTSSILAATVLAALNELCQLGWDTYTIGQRVLVLEQMLTSGGGWQDQFGGICRGLKFLETRPGLDQSPKISWIDDHLLTDSASKGNILLYYTGITRVAKGVLAEIVRGMFLNSGSRLDVLHAIGENAEAMVSHLQEGRYEDLCRGVAQSWELNQALDPGTCTAEIRRLMEPILPWTAGAKLLGAGGGGYLLILARDSTSAQKIKEQMALYPPNNRARFVDLAVSRSGLQVTRS